MNQVDIWNGEKEAVRDHVIVENRTQPSAVHMRSYVDERYKITIYYGQSYGKIFDLQEDPNELNNLWDDPDYASLKTNLLLKYAWAELLKELLSMPRVYGA